MPYAITVGATALVVGVLPTGFGLPVWLSYVMSIAILYLIIRYMGKKHPVQNKQTHPGRVTIPAASNE